MSTGVVGHKPVVISTGLFPRAYGFVNGDSTGQFMISHGQIAWDLNPFSDPFGIGELPLLMIHHE
jgi:hypothetical protein